MKKQQFATLKILKKQLLTLANSFFYLPTYSTTGKVSHHYLHTIRNQCSTLSKLNNFAICRKRCAATTKSESLLMILQSSQITLLCVEKTIFYQIVATVSKKLFLLMTLCTSLMRRTS